MAIAPAPLPFRHVDLGTLQYGPITKDVSARLYVVPIQSPVVIQTTPVTLTTTLEDPDIPFVFIEPDAKLRAFLERTEKTIEDACVANKDAWFAVSKHLEDDVLRRGFKSFFTETGFKVKVPADIACFDASKRPIGREDVVSGSVVRLVLELSRICFGKHEYGITWKAIQAQIVPTTCLIDDSDDTATEPVRDDADSDINEFL
jgi:hypothetical protein